MSVTAEYRLRDLCLRCGEPQTERHHKYETSLPEGWHTFRPQSYLDTLENALLFCREHPASEHEWVETGLIICTSPSFPEKCCARCTAINWGGNETGFCFGEFGRDVEAALVAAHNRRASNLRAAAPSGERGSK